MYKKLSTLRSALQNLKRSPAKQLSFGAGLYHFERQRLGERSRVHLRVDPDGSGLLLVNASRVMHLNPTAAFMARLALEQIPTAEAQRRIRRRYRVPAAQVTEDYAQFVAQLDELVRPDNVCPLHDLDLEVTAPFSARLSAPYRMDLALTYRCNNDCAHCYNARPRDYPELDTAHWMRALEHLWEIGIPHVVFTGGEPTLRDDLPELVAYAEKLGQISGLNTNGRRLSDSAYLRQLVDAGLDHVQITVESHDSEIHNRMVARRGAWGQTIAGLRNALDSPLFVMTNTTMLQENSPYLEGTLAFLASEGVPTVGLNALIYSGRGNSVGTGLHESKLTPLLEMARQRTQASGQRLIWYTPTQYCNFDPMLLELGIKGCTAALYNMCVEPDGRVIPCQSYYQPLGSLLNDPWESIWNHEICISLRERRYVAQKCRDCALLPECGGGCPLYAQHNP
jgi:radical SAM protein with 4Fe4S-binding SPASM domain